MAKCKKCNREYYNRECPTCKNKKELASVVLNKPKPKLKNIYGDVDKYEESLRNSKKTKTKTQRTVKEKSKLNIALIIIAVAVSVIALLMIAKEYRRQQEEKQIMRMFYGTDDYEKVEKINKKMMKNTEKSMEQFRRLYLPK